MSVKILLITMSVCLHNYCNAQTADIKDNFKFLSKYPHILEDLYHNKMLFAMEFLDMTTNKMGFPKEEDSYSTSPFSMRTDEKELLIRQLDTYLFRIGYNEAFKIINFLYDWNVIHNLLQVENIGGGVHHLDLLLGRMPSKFSPKYGKYTVFYRLQVTESGLQDTLASLDDEQSLRFAILMENTIYVYLLSPKERMEYFEVYFREANKLAKKK